MCCSRSVDHRDLHSFPTRRSSDLVLKLRSAGLDPGRFRVGAYGSDSARRADLPHVAADRAAALTGRRFAGTDIVIVGDTPDRSEEHTSELQSQFHLVCRLLLEKKN